MGAKGPGRREGWRLLVPIDQCLKVTILLELLQNTVSAPSVECNMYFVKNTIWGEKINENINQKLNNLIKKFNRKLNKIIKAEKEKQEKQ